MNTLDMLDTPTRGRDIRLHGPEGFEGMRRAGRLAAECLDMLTPHVVPGVETAYLDDLAGRLKLPQGLAAHLEAQAAAVG